MALKTSLQVPREKLEFIYSLFLMIAIPLLLVANTLVVLSNTRSDFDTELRRKADLANAVFGVVTAEQLTDESELERLVEAVAAVSADIDEVAVLAPAGDGFNALATTKTSATAAPFEDLQAALALARNDSIATLVHAEDSESQRAWRVVTPLEHEGEVVALASMSVSLDRADALMRSTAIRSIVILVITIAIIMLLLLNHFKFVEYAVLFQKQKEVDRLKNDFLQVATHELKAPMSVIKGSLSLVLDGDLGKVNKDVSERLQVAVAQTESLNRLVSDLLNVSRLEQGRIEFEQKAVNLVDILQPLVAALEGKARAKGLELEYRPAKLPAVMLDPDRTKEIFTNLIDNAIKYTQAGHISVYHQVEKGAVRTTIEDSGIGMSAKDRERLFSRFYRIRNEATQEISGTGLGLWIVKQYTEKMNGEIYVDSIEGVGSRFMVEFPSAKVKPQEQVDAG